MSDMAPPQPAVPPSAAQRRHQCERAWQWLDKHWKGSHACPICSSNTWDVGDVCELRGFTSEALVIGGGPAFPIFPLVCTVCGYTRFFNAYLAQVVALSSAQEDAACAVQ